MSVRLAVVFLLLFGGPLVAAEPILLRAGPLSVVFEPDNGMLRYVRIGNHKILQGVTAPVRNQHWGTVPAAVENVRLQDRGDSFTLAFDVQCREGDIDFFWKGRIAGTSEGRLTFTFNGEARSTFLRNRIGFCVLHGPEAAGRPCVMETVNGQAVKGHFPSFIAPHQPFKNIRAVSHEIEDGVWATVRMEGDTFEMEDQRNWTDASFKTYCTPLELTYPVRVEKGTQIVQKIELSVQGSDKLPRTTRDSDRRVNLTVSADRASRKRLPVLGLQVSSQVPGLSKHEIARLRDLNLNHLRVDIQPSEADSSVKLRQAAVQAKQLGVDLHVGLHLGEAGEGSLKGVTTVLGDISQPSAWLLVSANDRQVQAAREFLSRSGQGGKLGRGENTNFTELNRNRPDPKTIHAAFYGLNPQIHAFDNISMVETLAIQGDTVRSARQFVGDLALLISPITLRKQAVDEAPPAGKLPSNVDPRQASPFAAAWTLGSIKYLAESGADSVTYYETVGWRGIMESEHGTPLPDQFNSRPGQLFPIYHVLLGLSKFKGGYVRFTNSTDAMSVVGLAVEQGNQQRLMVANLTNVKQAVSVRGFADTAELAGLDGDMRTTILRATSGEGLVLELQPYESVVLDSK